MNQEQKKRVSQAQSILEEVRDAQQDSYDNMPSGFQDGPVGSRMTEEIEHLEGAISELEELA